MSECLFYLYVLEMFRLCIFSLECYWSNIILGVHSPFLSMSPFPISPHLCFETKMLKFSIGIVFGSVVLRRFSRTGL